MVRASPLLDLLSLIDTSCWLSVRQDDFIDNQSENLSSHSSLPQRQPLRDGNSDTSYDENLQPPLGPSRTTSQPQVFAGSAHILGQHDRKPASRIMDECSIPIQDSALPFMDPLHSSSLRSYKDNDNQGQHTRSRRTYSGPIRYSGHVKRHEEPIVAYSQKIDFDSDRNLEGKESTVAKETVSSVLGKHNHESEFQQLSTTRLVTTSPHVPTAKAPGEARDRESISGQL
jgi:hypothetical protein